MMLLRWTMLRPQPDSFAFHQMSVKSMEYVVARAGRLAASASARKAARRRRKAVMARFRERR